MSGSPRCLVTWCHVVNHATLLESHVDKQNTSEIIISNSHVSPAMSHVCHMYSCHNGPAIFVCPAIPAIIISTMRLTMTPSLLSIDSNSCSNSCSNRFKFMLSIVPIDSTRLDLGVPSLETYELTGFRDLVRLGRVDFPAVISIWLRIVQASIVQVRIMIWMLLRFVPLSFTVFRWPRSFATRSSVQGSERKLGPRTVLK